MYSYTVTIGRGVCEAAMSAVGYATFEADVLDTLLDVAQRTMEADGEFDYVIEVHRGVGVWEGQPEDSTKTTMLSEQPMTYTYDLRRQLSELARYYEQDAIALTIGESELC